MKINTTMTQETSQLSTEQTTQESIGMENLKERLGLFDHQVEGIKFLVDKKKAILADSMGVGKTKQAIIAAGITSKESILVICPASLKVNWLREIRMVYPEH